MEYLKDDNFDSKTSTGKVLIQFSAEWCGPCKILSPTVEKLENIIKFKVDVDDCPETSKKFKIRSVPTLILIENGVEKARKVGVLSKDMLESFVSQ